MSYLNTISFPLAADRITHYSTGTNAIYAQLFDTTNNLMVLKIRPRDYTPVVESLGSTDVARGVSSTVVRTPTTKTGATIKTAAGMGVIAAVINELRQNAIDDDSHTITVYDACHIEFEDEDQGYTVREWWLREPVVPNAAMAKTGGANSKPIYDAFVLEFMEL